MPELKAEIEKSYTPKVQIKPVETVFDVKDWIEGDIDDMSGHIHQHQFKIERNRAGDVVVYYRKWSTDSKWLPENGIRTIDKVPEGKRILGTIYCVRRTLPNLLGCLWLDFLSHINNKCLIDQACSVKIAGYWPRSFLRFYGPRLRLGP